MKYDINTIKNTKNSLIYINKTVFLCFYCVLFVI